SPFRKAADSAAQPVKHFSAAAPAFGYVRLHSSTLDRVEQAMNRILITAVALVLGLAASPSFAGGYVVNGHTASRAETQFLASYGVQPGSWKVDGYGISPAVQQSAPTTPANAQNCHYVLDVLLCD